MSPPRHQLTYQRSHGGYLPSDTTCWSRCQTLSLAPWTGGAVGREFASCSAARRPPWSPVNCSCDHSTGARRRVRRAAQPSPRRRGPTLTHGFDRPGPIKWGVNVSRARGGLGVPGDDGGGARYPGWNGIAIRTPMGLFPMNPSGRASTARTDGNSRATGPPRRADRPAAADSQVSTPFHGPPPTRATGLLSPDLPDPVNRLGLGGWRQEPGSWECKPHEGPGCMPREEGARQFRPAI